MEISYRHETMQDGAYLRANERDGLIMQHNGIGIDGMEDPQGEWNECILALCSLEFQSPNGCSGNENSLLVICIDWGL
jgi:hypothetical protein